MMRPTPHRIPIFSPPEAVLEFMRELKATPTDRLLRALTLRVNYSIDFSSELPVDEYRQRCDGEDAERQARRREAFRCKFDEVARSCGFRVDITYVQMASHDRELSFCTLSFFNTRPPLK